MAHKKGQGSVRNGRESNSQRLGIKLYSGESVRAGKVGIGQQDTSIGAQREAFPPDFDVPRRLETPQFVLEPLDPEHNDQDYDAWTSKIERSSWNISRTWGVFSSQRSRVMFSEARTASPSICRSEASTTAG